MTKRTCSEPGCNRPRCAKGLCRRCCNRRWRRRRWASDPQFRENMRSKNRKAAATRAADPDRKAARYAAQRRSWRNRYANDPAFRERHQRRSREYRRKSGGKKYQRWLPALVMEQGFHCGICGGPLPADQKAHVDHARPVSKGGTHAKANLQAACPRCNLRKGAKAP